MSWLEHEREYRGDVWLKKVKKLNLEYLVKAARTTLIHAGIGDGFGEVKRNSNYIVPEDAQTDDLCEFPVAEISSRLLPHYWRRVLYNTL